MKKGFSLYAVFAILCVIALSVLIAGCNPNGNIDDDPDFSSSYEYTYSGESITDGDKFENGDYDRNDVNNANSDYSFSNGAEETESRVQHKPSITSSTSTSSKKPTTSSSASSSASSSTSSSASSSSSEASSSSSSATSSGSNVSLNVSRDDTGWSDRWY